MGKRYTSEERREALKLADEIGPAAAARRLGINTDTLYGWRSGRKSELPHWRRLWVAGAKLSCWQRSKRCGNS